MKTHLDENIGSDSFICYILIRNYLNISLASSDKQQEGFFNIEKNDFGSISFLLKEEKNFLFHFKDRGSVESAKKKLQYLLFKI